MYLFQIIFEYYFNFSKIIKFFELILTKSIARFNILLIVVFATWLYNALYDKIQLLLMKNN